MNTLILTVGLPRSGKSTWAKSTGLPIVNPDAIRLALHGHNYITDAEPMVWVIAKYMVRALFLSGHNEVILDATNLTKKRRDEWIGPWNIEYKLFTHVSKEECIKRAINSNREDLIPVIERMIYEEK
jgi:predicted kinase